MISSPLTRLLYLWLVFLFNKRSSRGKCFLFIHTWKQRYKYSHLDQHRDLYCGSYTKKSTTRQALLLSNIQIDAINIFIGDSRYHLVAFTFQCYQQIHSSINQSGYWSVSKPTDLSISVELTTSTMWASSNHHIVI